MKELVFNLFIISMLICSCNSDNNRQINIDNSNKIEKISDTPDNKLIFYEINNEILVNEIKMYMDSINNKNYMKKIYSSTFEEEWGWLESFSFKYKKNKIVSVGITKVDDITKYILFYSLDPPSLFYTFSKVDDIMVIIYYDNIRDIKLPDSVMWRYMKDYFPKEYKIYIENKDNDKVFITSTAGGGLEWHLIFKDGILIDKTEEITF